MKQHFRVRKKRDKGNVGAGYRTSGKIVSVNAEDNQYVRIQSARVVKIDPSPYTYVQHALLKNVTEKQETVRILSKDFKMQLNTQA